MGNYKVGHRYSEEFKNKAVRMIIADKKTPKEVADKLDVRVSVVCDWIAEPLILELRKSETEIVRLKKELDKTADERVRTLQRENQELKDQVDILKKTVAIFSANK